MERCLQQLKKIWEIYGGWMVDALASTGIYPISRSMGSRSNNDFIQVLANFQEYLDRYIDGNIVDFAILTTGLPNFDEVTKKGYNQLSIPELPTSLVGKLSYKDMAEQLLKMKEERGWNKKQDF